jgi:hypothetical protein
MSTPMPTGAKLVGAISFAIVGWIVANYYVPNMPDAEGAGRIREGAAFLGAVIGWMVMGSSVGGGYLEAAGAGIKTMAVLLFFGLLSLSLAEMLENSFKFRYEGAFDALVDVFMTMVERSQALLSMGVIGSMLIGGIVGGIVTENASRRWR